MNLKSTVVLLALAACGGTQNVGQVDGGPPDGGTDGGGAGGGDLPFDQLQAQFTQTYCSLVAQCHAQPAYFQPHCAALYGATIATTIKDVDAGLVIYDGAAARACLDFIAGEGCALFDPHGSGAGAVACAKVFAGAVALGGTCYDSADCDNGLCTADFPSQMACPGTCFAYPQLGQDCSQIPFCAPGLYCAGQASADGGFTGHCQQTPDAGPPAQAGEACAGRICASGLFCAVNGASTACTPYLSQGASCTRDDQCVGTLLCAGFSVSPGGMVTHGFCAPASDVGGTCTPLPAGTSDGDTGCLTGLACLGNVCQVPPSSGPCSGDLRQECDEFSQCSPSTQTCQADLTYGDVCQPGTNLCTCDNTNHCGTQLCAVP